MAELDTHMVHYLAKLSRIAVSLEEEESLLKDLAKIVRYVEQLNEVNTEHVAPCTYVTQALTQTPVRKDEVEVTLTREELTKLAPLHVGGMIRVPPVIKREA